MVSPKGSSSLSTASRGNSRTSNAVTHADNDGSVTLTSSVARRRGEEKRAANRTIAAQMARSLDAGIGYEMVSFFLKDRGK